MRIFLLLNFIASFCFSVYAGEAAETAPAGMFVAVGYGGFRGWSVDGENWTAERWSDKNADDTNLIIDVTCRAGIFLCGGGGTGKGFILRSTDGKHWDEVIQTKWRIQPLATLEDRFFAVFNDHFQLSTDGIKWTQAAEAKPILPDGGPGWHSGYFRHIAIGNGVVVLGGDYALPGGVPRVGWIGSTKNGETPLVLQRQESDVIGVAFGNGRFVACTRKGTLLTSIDGVEFKKTDLSSEGRTYHELRFHDGLFYLNDSKGVQTSSDGERWEAIAKPPRFPRAVSPNGVTVVCGWGGIQYATDGKTYHKAKVAVDQTAVNAVIYGIPLANLPKDQDALKEKK